MDTGKIIIGLTIVLIGAGYAIHTGHAPRKEHLKARAKGLGLKAAKWMKAKADFWREEAKKAEAELKGEPKEEANA